MKIFVGILLCAFAALTKGEETNDRSCNPREILDLPEEWKSLARDCTNEMRRQIQEEINASNNYLALAAHFSRDTINRPGFAKLFFEAAREEREHAIHLIEYLTMRGELTGSISDLIQFKPVKIDNDWNGVKGLRLALELETKVTKSINQVIEKCEKAPAHDYPQRLNYAGQPIKSVNDYHLVDYLTGVYLEEQLKGQRDLAGKLSTLSKMMEQHRELGEFLFDKSL